MTSSVVVPCYNEAKNLPALIAGFAALRDEHSEWELLLVNNGSTDDSATVFERELAAPARAFVRVVTVEPPNVGYGHGIITGLRAASGEWLAWTHADLQTPPADVLVGLHLLRASADPTKTFVKGRRRNRPTKDTLFTFGMQVAALGLLGCSLTDINAQPKCFHRSLFDLATDAPVDLSLDLYFYWLAQSHNYAIRTFDVVFGERLHGESKWAFNWRSKARNIGRTITFMGQLRRGRPYRTA